MKNNCETKLRNKDEQEDGGEKAGGDESGENDSEDDIEKDSLIENKKGEISLTVIKGKVNQDEKLEALEKAH